MTVCLQYAGRGLEAASVVHRGWFWEYVARIGRQICDHGSKVSDLATRGLEAEGRGSVERFTYSVIPNYFSRLTFDVGRSREPVVI
jgi:hypothetical protein